MNKIFAQTFLAIAIGASTPIMCTDNAPKPYTTKNYYGKHLVTSLLASLSIPICTWVGFGLGAAATLGSDLDKNPLPLLTALAGSAAGFSILYKTPEWTNSYFFNKPTTTEQNITQFLSHFFLGWPIGVLIGLYLNDDCDSKIRNV